MRRASIVFGCFLVLHTMHGHCNHTGKIRSAADSQNAQHNSFLRFESYAAFSQRLISLYSLHYTHPRGKFNRFVQFAFPVFIYFAQSTSSFMNCRKVFLQFILHFCNCIPCFGILQKCRSSVKKSTYFCRFSAVHLQVPFLGCMPSCIFFKCSVISSIGICKNRRKSKRTSAGSVNSPSKICEIPPQTQPLHDHLVFAHAAGREVALQIKG